MDRNKGILQFINPKKQEIPDEDYFVKMAETIILKKDQPETKIISFYKKPVFKWIAAAAVVLPITLFITLKSQQKSSTDILLGLNEIPKSEIQAYILENIEEFNEEEIIEFTDIKTIDNFRSSIISLKTGSHDDIFNTVSKEDIKTYFEEEEFDLEELEDDELFI